MSRHINGGFLAYSAVCASMIIEFNTLNVLLDYKKALNSLVEHNTNLNDKIDTLISHNQNLENKFDTLISHNQNLENKFDTLIKQNEDLNNKFDTLIEILKSK